MLEKERMKEQTRLNNYGNVLEEKRKTLEDMHGKELPSEEELKDFVDHDHIKDVLTDAEKKAFSDLPPEKKKELLRQKMQEHDQRHIEHKLEHVAHEVAHVSKVVALLPKQAEIAETRAQRVSHDIAHQAGAVKAVHKALNDLDSRKKELTLKVATWTADAEKQRTDALLHINTHAHEMENTRDLIEFNKNIKAKSEEVHKYIEDLARSLAENKNNDEKKTEKDQGVTGEEEENDKNKEKENEEDKVETKNDTKADETNETTEGENGNQETTSTEEEPKKELVK